MIGGPFLFLGILGTAVFMALRDQHERLKAIEQKQDGSRSNIA